MRILRAIYVVISMWFHRKKLWCGDIKLTNCECEWPSLCVMMIVRLLTRQANSLVSIDRNVLSTCRRWGYSARHNCPSQMTWFRFAGRCHSHVLLTVHHHILDRHHDLRHRHTSTDPLNSKETIVIEETDPKGSDIPRLLYPPTDFGDSKAPVGL